MAAGSIHTGSAGTRLAVGLGTALAALLVGFAPAASAHSTVVAHAARAGTIVVSGYDGGVALDPSPSASGATAHRSSKIFTTDDDYTIPATQQQESEAQKKAADKTAELEDKLGDTAMVFGGALIGYGALSGPGEVVAGPVGLGIVAFGAGLKIGGAIGKYLWGDPFKDHHFELIAKPLPVKIPPIGGSGASAVDHAGGRYLTANLTLAEHGQAYQTSLNRALGAHAAHNKHWTVLQLSTAAGYAKRGATLFLSLHGLREQFTAAVDSSGLSTITVPATTEAKRKAALKTELAKLPKAVNKLFNSPPLRGHGLSTLLGQALGGNSTGGVLALGSAFENPGLDKAEDALAGHLRTFAQIVKHLKPGQLPAGL